MASLSARLSGPSWGGSALFHVVSPPSEARLVSGHPERVGMEAARPLEA